MNPKLRYIFIIVLAFNLINTVSWLDINSTKISIVKIHDMLKEDKGWYYRNKVPWEECLAMNYYRNGLPNIAIPWYRLAHEKYGESDGRMTFNYATVLLEQGDTLGIALLEDLIVRFPNYQLAKDVLKEAKLNLSQQERPQ